MNDITVITPLYNSEQYLFKCLDSLYKNDTSTLEHILVNDGSPGFTDDIAQRIKENYPKTTVIDKKVNEGIGFAYRDAIAKASGKYIMFLDSDDTLSEGSIATILNIMKETDPDIVQFSGISIDDKGNILEKTVAENIHINNKKELWEYHFNVFKFPGLSLRAYKRELFSDLVFLKQNSGIDELLTAQLVYRAESLVSTNTEVYIRLMHRDSVSQNRFSEQYLSLAHNVFSAVYHSEMADNNTFIKYWNDKFISFVLHYYNLAIMGKIDFSAEKVLSVMNYDAYYEKFHSFYGCFENRLIHKISFYIFSHFRKIYNLIVKMI